MNFLEVDDLSLPIIEKEERKKKAPNFGAFFYDNKFFTSFFIKAIAVSVGGSVLE